MKPYRKAHAMLVAAGFLLAGSEMKAAYKPKNRIAQEKVLLRVYLVGHGAACGNVPHPADMTAQKLDSLTPSGLEQAAEAEQILREKTVVSVIASPTGRTRQTAAAITDALGLHGGYLQDAAFASLKAGDTPMCKRCELHGVPTGSVSEILVTDVGWYLLKEGLTRAEKG